jgi:hypothetical protein
MRRIERIGARRRSKGVPLVGVTTALSAAVLLATAVTALATIARGARGPEAAQAGSRCDYRVYAPTAHYTQTTHSSDIVARAPFSCTTSHRNSTATVVMERFSNRKWNRVASMTRQLYVRAGAKYAVHAKWQPTIRCSGGLVALKVRTHFALKLNGTLTIDYTTPSETVDFPCTS